MSLIRNGNTSDDLRTKIDKTIDKRPHETALKFINNNAKHLSAIFAPATVNIQVLMMNNCRIESIDVDTFANLPHLRHLDLKKNRLHALENDLFRYNTQLEYLDLSRNCVEFVDREFYEHLNRIVVLNMSGNRLRDFSNLSFPHLLKLDLHANTLRVFDNVYMPRVYKLNLSRNELCEIRSRIENFRDCKRNGLFVLGDSLRRLELGNNYFRALDSRLFERAINLTHLCLCENFIVELPEHCFRTTAALTYFCMTRNCLERVPCLLFWNCDRLQTICFDHNSIESIEKDAFVALKNLVELNICFNWSHGIQLLEIPDGLFGGNVSLVKLNLRDSHITEIGSGAFCALNSLKVLDLSGNRLIGLPERFLPCGSFALDAVSLAKNPFRRNVTFRLHGYDRDSVDRIIDFLDLSDTSITNFDSRSFDGLRIRCLKMHRNISMRNSNRLSLLDFSTVRDLKSLMLSHNDLSAFGVQVSSEDESLPIRYRKNPFFGQPLFYDCNCLIELCMHSCKITYISEVFFQNLIHLAYLDLSDNRLKYLDACLIPLTNLKSLNLRNNVLVDFNENPFFFNRKLKCVDLTLNNLTVLNEEFVRDIRHLEIDYQCTVRKC